MNHTVIKRVTAYGIHLTLYLDGDEVGQYILPHNHARVLEIDDDGDLFEDATVKGDRNRRAFKALIN